MIMQNAIQNIDMRAFVIIHLPFINILAVPITLKTITFQDILASFLTE